MRIYFLILFLTFQIIYSQNEKEITGNISYISGKTIYVKFENTLNINIGDTIYFKNHSELFPAIIVKYKSSKSISGVNISEKELVVGTELIAKIKFDNEKNRMNETNEKEEQKISDTKQENISPVNKISKSKVYGYFNINSFSNRSNINTKDYQNWRMNLSFNVDSLFNKGLSFTSYLNFSYRVDQWKSIKNSLGKAINIYDLAFNYHLNNSFLIIFGRKINPYTSSLGAIDGLQFEKKLNKFNLGIILGSRPNYTDYGFNFKLFEFGSYLNYRDSIGDFDIQNSIGLFNQTNNFKTDRRFFYLQNFSSLNDFTIFVSTEVDLYKKINEQSQNVFNLTSTFLNLSFRPTYWLNISTSFDIRKNIFYFETYKTYIDSLIEASKRQGLSFRVNFKPFNFLLINSNYSNYKSKTDVKATENYGLGFYIPSVPFILTNLNFSYNNLSTLYVKSDYYNLSIYKDFFTGKLSSGLNVKFVKYKFIKSNYISEDKIIGLDLYYSITKLLNLYLNYEGTFQNKNTYWRTYFGLNTRF
ncbi:MAG: hypothetical protein ACOYU5_12530 [Stygiobacter sp.]